MSEALEALLVEGRTFKPSREFQKKALTTLAEMYDDADYDWEGFWAQQALQLDWHNEWHTILEWDLPFAKWFVGGTLNVSENCLDRHVKAGHGEQIALHWEGEPGDQRAISYKDLLESVCKIANALRELGVNKGDRVAIYMGMVPELPAAMLACARIGAIHSVCLVDLLRSRCAIESTMRRPSCSSPKMARIAAAACSISRELSMRHSRSVQQLQTRLCSSAARTM